MTAADPQLQHEPTETRPGVSWRRNLAGLWISQFTAFFGFSFLFPFVPLFLNRDLGLSSESQIAFWTGVAGSATGFSMALFSPIWGAIADRHGRRAMVLRAMIGGGVLMALMAAVQSPAQLAGARLLFGVTAGTIGASSALVAAETPPRRVGWALGILSSAIAMGRAVGPMTAGLLAAFVSLRVVFLIGAAMLLLATVPVMLLVRETPRPTGATGRPRGRVRDLLLAAGPGTGTIVVVLIVCGGLVQFGSQSANQLIVVRLITLDPHAAALATGGAFAAVGLASGIASTTYSRLIPLTGYRRLAVLAGLLMAGSTIGAAVAPTLGLVVAATAAVGLLYGVVNPALSSMLGLETPTDVKATVFGINSSAVALGTAFGPLLAGLVASAAGVTAGLTVSAAALLFMALVMLLRGREPAV